MLLVGWRASWTWLVSSITLYNKLVYLFGKDPEMKRPLRRILEIEARGQSDVGKCLATKGSFVEARGQFRNAWRTKSMVKATMRARIVRRGD
jgi:hypothetical protein